MKTDLEWKAERRVQEKAIEHAAEILELFGLSEPPLDPFDLIKAEEEDGFLVAKGDDFGTAFDGQLEYLPSKQQFLLLYNTRYNTLNSPGHQPRTRFSVAHELGHYYIERHNAYLRGGGSSHVSRSEFRRGDSIVEREADSFASGLLMPKKLMSPLVNQGELTLSRIDAIATTFRTSRVSTAIRSVRLSHFPCAVVGIREGAIRWSFCSEALIQGSCYPGPKGVPSSAKAREIWEALGRGIAKAETADGPASNWLSVHGDHLSDLQLTEHYIPVPVMDTLIVLLTLDEDDVFPENL